MRICNEECIFYREIKKSNDSAVGGCRLFNMIVKYKNKCHNEIKANRMEKEIKREHDPGFN